MSFCYDTKWKRAMMEAEVKARAPSARPPTRESRHSEDQLHEVFNLFDCDRSGRIEMKEMEMLLKGMGYGDVTTADFLRGPQSLTFDEFKAIINKNVAAMDSEEEVKRAFGIFDKAQRGSVDAAALVAVARSTDSSLTEAEVQDVLSWCDIDGDGVINFQDFKEVMDFMRITTRK